MKKLLLALALSLPLFATAGEMSVQLHGFSKHAATQNNYKFNEQNFGAGVRYQQTSDVGYQAGFYDNSYNKQTVYALLQYTPVHIGKTSVGVFGGYASGYNFDYPVIAGFMSTTDFGKFTVSLRFVPKISVNTTSVVAIEAGIKF